MCHLNSAQLNTHNSPVLASCEKSGGPRVDSVTAAAILPLPIEPTHLTVTMFASRGWYPQNRIFQLFGAGGSRNFIFSGEFYTPDSVNTTSTSV